MYTLLNNEKKDFTSLTITDFAVNDNSKKLFILTKLKNKNSLYFFEYSFETNQLKYMNEESKLFSLGNRFISVIHGGGLMSSLNHDGSMASEFDNESINIIDFINKRIIPLHYKNSAIESVDNKLYKKNAFFSKDSKKFIYTFKENSQDLLKRVTVFDTKTGKNIYSFPKKLLCENENDTFSITEKYIIYPTEETNSDRYVYQCCDLETGNLLFNYKTTSQACYCVSNAINPNDMCMAFNIAKNHNGIVNFDIPSFLNMKKLLSNSCIAIEQTMQINAIVEQAMTKNKYQLNQQAQATIESINCIKDFKDLETELKKILYSMCEKRN